MMRKVTILALLVLAAFAFTALLVTAQEAKEAPKHEYVGAEKCKMCHKDQFTSWSETGHAKAYTKLSDEEKKNPDCVKCHVSGSLADGTLLEGIQCEGCHGPGSDYKSAKIMSKTKWAADPAAYKQMAIDAGLKYPTEEDCRQCHKKEGNANFKEFDFAKFKPMVHTMTVKTEVKAEEGK